MHTINREDLSLYAQQLKGLTNEELHKEIWLLSEHIQYLQTGNEDAKLFVVCIMIAKEEKEMRMFSQGYQ